MSDDLSKVQTTFKVVCTLECLLRINVQRLGAIKAELLFLITTSGRSSVKYFMSVTYVDITVLVLFSLKMVFILYKKGCIVDIALI